MRVIVSDEFRCGVEIKCNRLAQFNAIRGHDGLTRAHENINYIRRMA